MHHIIGHNFDDIIHSLGPPIAPIMSSLSSTAKINLTGADIWIVTSPYVHFTGIWDWDFELGPHFRLELRCIT